MVKKLFYQMLLAQVASSVAVMIAMLVDSVMIGQFLGSDYMAGYGFANPMVLLVSAIASTLSTGAQVVCSNALGSARVHKANQYFSVAAVLAMGIAVTSMILVMIFSSPLASLMGAKTGPVHEMTRDYIVGFYIGAPAMLGSLVMIPFMQLAGEQKRLVTAVLAMTVTDIILDYINVKVVHGGLLGMGIASSLSYYVAFAIGISYFFMKKAIFKFRISEMNKKDAKEILKNGITTIINMVSGVLLAFTLNILLSSLTNGNHNVAAYSILNTMVNFSYAIIIGISSIVLMMSGIFSGEEDRSAICELIRVGSRFAVISHMFLTVVVFFGAPILVGGFISTEDPVYKIGTEAVRLFSLSLVPCSLNVLFKNLYQGTGRVGLAQVFSVLQNFAALALSAFVLSRFFGTRGIWLCYILGESIVFITICAITFIYNKKIVISSNAFSLLPKDFGVAQDCFFDAVIKSVEDVGSTARDATEFCRKHNISERKTGYVSHCIEEATLNIVQHGFKEGSDQAIDLRVLLKGENLIIRIRDDCAQFDPLAYAKNLEKNREQGLEEQGIHTGITILYQLAKEVKYTYTMSMNNLTIYL